MNRTSASLAVLSLSIAACAGLAESSSARGRDLQTDAILTEVLRYQVQDLAKDAAVQQQGVVCVGVLKDNATVDPGRRVMQQLPAGDRIREQSRCPADSAGTLVVGPIDWIADTEVRVRSVRRVRHQAATPVVYRVVRDAGRWVCVGPILAYDPL